jgi:hypothetical protein
MSSSAEAGKARTILHCSVSIFVSLFFSWSVHAQKSAPEDLLLKLRNASIKGASFETLLRDGAHLLEYGDRSITPICSALEEEKPNEPEQLKVVLVITLAKFKSDDATEAMLKYTLSYKDASLGRLSLQRLMNRKVACAVTHKEFLQLASLIDQETPFKAGAYALVLSNCTQVSDEQKTEVILTRFLREAARPESQFTKIAGVDMTSKLASLGNFYFALANLGEPVRLPLASAARSSSPKDAVFITIARGMSGDESVAENLRSLVESGGDKYLRRMCVAAYARAKGEYSIPLLEKWESDETESDRVEMSGKRRKLISEAAREEIRRIKDGGGQDNRGQPPIGNRGQPPIN